MTNRSLLVKDIFQNGKQGTWDDYAIKYDIKDAKTANDYYRWFIKNGSIEGCWEPGILEEIENTSIEIEHTSIAPNHIEEVKEEFKIPEGARVTKVWGKPGNYNYSFDYNKEQVDIKTELLKEFKEFSPKPSSPIIYTKNNDSIVYLLSLPDMHFGKTYIEKTIGDFRNAIVELLSRVDVTRIEKFILPIGNDLFHTEGTSQATTKGTKMFDYSEWKDCFSIVWKLLIEEINKLELIAPIEIPIVLGNHSEGREYYLGCLLEAFYMNNPNVNVLNDSFPRKYLQFGKVLLGFDHGELKPGEYPLLMATERPVEFSISSTRIMLCGHLHSQQNYEIKGVHVRFLPSLCPSDNWHDKMGYSSQKAAQGYKFNHKGLMGYEEYRIE